MKLPNKLFRSKFGVSLAFVVLVLVFSIGSIFVISQYKKNAIISFNEEVRVFAKISTRAVVQNYELYHDSGLFKLEEMKNDILNQSESIEKFEIIDTDGKVLYESNRKNSTKLITDEEIIDALRSPEPLYTYNEEGGMSFVLYPYIEDWGAHKYSVEYTISSEKLNNNLNLYRNEVVLVSILLVFLSFIPIFGVFSLREIEQEREGRKRLEALNKQKDNFMILVAHNLRTPISIMKGYANLAGEKSLSGIEREYVDAIIEGTERLNGVTETIIRVNEILSGSKLVIKKEKLETIINDAVSLCTDNIKKKKINLKVNFGKALPEVGISKNYLEKAILNLIDNAIKFNKEKGSISIDLKTDGPNMIFSIKDTGIGIKKSEQKTIFTSFHRAIEDPLSYDYSGLGMGLYLAKVVIEAHDGKIWVESKFGKGSTFSFSLPIKG